MVKPTKQNLLLIISNPYAFHPLLSTFEILAQSYNIFIVISNNFLKSNYKYKLLLDEKKIKELHILNLYREDGQRLKSSTFKEMLFIYIFIKKYKNIKFKMIFSHASQEMYEYLLIKFFSKNSFNTVCLWPLTINIDDLYQSASKPNYIKFIKDSPRYLISELKKLIIYQTNKFLFKILFNLKIENWKKKNLIGIWIFEFILCTNRRIEEIIKQNYEHKKIILTNFNFTSYKSKSEPMEFSALVNFGLRENENIKITEILLKIKKELNINNFIIRFHPRQTKIDKISHNLRRSNLENLKFVISREDPLEVDMSKVDFFISEPSSSLLYALGYFPIERIFGLFTESQERYNKSILYQLGEHIDWSSMNRYGLLCQAINLNSHQKLINVIEDILLENTRR